MTQVLGDADYYEIHHFLNEVCDDDDVSDVHENEVCGDYIY